MASAGLGGKQALTALLIIWTFAAFGEELGYRGYLLRRAADLFGRSNMAYFLAMVGRSSLWFRHYYKVRPACSIAPLGLVLGGFTYSPDEIFGRDPTHGFSSTFAVVVLFMGWAS